MTRQRCDRYTTRHKVDTLDAAIVPDEMCPDCGSEVARITFTISRLHFLSRRMTVESVRTVVACADEDLCGWFRDEVPV